jgi:bifunctional UDP-N-acetylglucosamine pyrophosphorylase/glucosamine-1-phosphate N-acetyltransferase
MDAGVTFLDPTSVHLSADAVIGKDSVVGPTVRIEGATRIGQGCTIDGAAHLKDTVVGDGVLLRWGVVTDQARIGTGAKVGPYAHLRPDADLGADVHVGNFVEVKKSKLGRGSKANHLTYIGDATVGRDVNVGAGTITCNYDGFAKHRTVIGDRVQIGSDTQLVAPVELGADCYVAAGSTVTKDVEAGALVFNDKPQLVRAGWVKRFRARAGAVKASEPDQAAATGHGSRKSAAAKTGSSAPAASRGKSRKPATTRAANAGRGKRGSR